MWKRLMSRTYNFHGLWRTYNLVLSICCMIISGILGPIVNLAFVTAGPEGELATICKNEPDYCTLLTYLNYLMWILFFASITLFLACWFNSICLTHCCMGLIVVNMVFSLIIFTKYVVYCSVYDRMCLDHSKDREGDDVATVVNMFFLNFVYLIFLGTILFFVYQYKRSLEYRYIGFVLFYF